MAEVLLARKLDERGIEARVSSAGVLPVRSSAAPDSVAVMADRGHDISGHRSRQVTGAMVARADLVVGMERLHVREIVVLDRDAFARAFTLRELVRRGTEVGPRGRGEPLGEWLGRLHRGRRAADLLDAAPEHDIHDPIGRPRAEFEAAAREIRLLLETRLGLAPTP